MVFLAPRAPCQASTAQMAELTIEPVAWSSPATVFDLAQDAEGMLWVASDEGLHRFDGTTFSPILRSLPKGRDGAVRRVFLLEGAVFAATGAGIRGLGAEGHRVDWAANNPGLVRLESGKHTEIVRGQTWVWDLTVAPDPQKGYWCATSLGLHQTDGRSLTPLTLRGLPEGVPIAALARTASGTIWLGTTSGLFRANSQGATATSIVAPVRDLALGPDERLWVATEEGIFHEASEMFEPVTEGRAETILVTRSGHLWAATGSGVAQWPPESLRREPGESATRAQSWETVAGAPIGRVLALLEDREGSIWAGTRAGGLVQFRRRNVINIGKAEGFDGTAFATLRTRTGEIWATGGKNVLRYRQGVLQQYAHGVEVPDYGLRGMAEAKDGNIWFASRRGLVVWNGEGFRLQALPERLRDRKTRSLLGTQNGDLWVSWEGGGLTRFERAMVADETAFDWEPTHLCPGTLSLPAEGADGTLWWGAHDGGLVRIQGERTACLSEADGIPVSPKVVSALRDGRVLVGGRETLQLTLVTPRGQISRLPAPLALQGNGIHAAVEDSGLWIGTDRGMAFVDQTTWQRCLAHRCDVLPSRYFDRSSGMRSYETTATFTPTGAIDMMHRIWLPTVAGLVVIDPPKAWPRTIADSLIQDIRVDGRAVTRFDEIIAGSSVEVGFVAPTFLSPSAPLFQFRLVGLTEVWSAPSSTRRAHFANLPAGAYRFEVRAVRSDREVTGKLATSAFVVRKRFHETAGFKLLILSLSLAAVFVFFRWRLWVARRGFLAIEAERARIARDLHDALAQGFTSLAYLLDAVQISLQSGATDKARSTAQTAREILNHCQVEARHAISTLRASQTGSPSLEQRLTRIVKEAAAAGSARVTLSLPPQPRALPPLVVEELPRVVQEATTNAQRHASASNIHVAVEVFADRMEVVVKDDGTGMATATVGPAPGFGVLGMKERVARLGGTMEIEGRQGTGTSVRIVVPMSNRNGALSG